MAVVPVLPAVTGGVYTSSQVSQIVQVCSFLLNRPAAELRQATTQSIPNGVFTSIAFDAHDLDANPSNPFTPGHSDSTNNSRYTAVYAGWYLCAGLYAPTVNATGVRGVVWAVNGTMVNASDPVLPATAAAGAGYPANTQEIYLNVGDYLEMQVYQSSGGALGTSVSGSAASRMSLIWQRYA